jgi:hypothetical protein
LDNNTIIVTAGILVTLPVILGIVLRQIHASTFRTLALPWLFTTVIFVVAILKIERMRGMPHLILSTAIALAWTLTGIFLRFFQTVEMKLLPKEIREIFSGLGIIFMIFGLAWGGVTVFQHWK